PRQSGEEGVPLAGRCEAAQVNPILVKHMHMKPIDDEIKHPLPPRHDVSPDVHGASGQARRPLADRRTSGATPGGSLAARAASASLARPCWARHEQRRRRRPGAQGGWFSWTALGVSEVEPNSYAP